MNHLGDTNKMVETPRTDAAWKTLHTIYELAGEMKRMERELNAANQRIKRLEEAGDEMEKYCRDYYSSNKWYKAKEAK